MFGYLNINKATLEEGQRGLWQAFMCGLCFSTKKLFGNLPRMAITNDINFFNVLFASVTESDVQLKQTRCFSHPVRKRTVVETSDLTDKLAVANVLLAYLKLADDAADGKKRIASKLFSKPFKKACAAWRELAENLTDHCKQLSCLEGANCANLDEVAHCFSALSQDLCTFVLGDKASEFAQTLCYNLGKWVYLADALDDVAEDLKKHTYNAFLACYGAHSVAELATHYDEISFVMYAVLNRVAQSFNDMNLTKYVCILKNVLFDSIRTKTEQILLKLKEEH